MHNDDDPTSLQSHYDQRRTACKQPLSGREQNVSEANEGVRRGESGESEEMASARPTGWLRARHARHSLPHFDNKTRACNWLQRRAASVNLASSAPITLPSLPRILMDVTRFAASTASVLYGDNPPYLGAQIAPILAPRGEASGQVEREFLAELTQRAAAAALSLACGSILAGRTSESDDYGDVALWLGKGDFGLGREREILDALALRSRLTPRPKVSECPTVAMR